MTNQKRILIIGGSSGMGEAGAQALSDNGWQVVIADRAEPENNERISGFTRADISSETEIARAVEFAAQRLGGLDAVWNNAGTCLLGTVESMNPADFLMSFMLNVHANALLARYAIPHLRRNKGGSILFTASAASVTISQGTLPYGVTKAALIALTRQLALEYAAENIRVNAICPGWIDTPFNAPSWELFGGRDAFLEKVPAGIPLSRMGTVEEIGQLVNFLLSEQARFMTGQAIVIDGGESLKVGTSR